MTYELPKITLAELEAAKDLQHRVMEFASLAHELASERVALLQAVDPLAYAGQHPLPEDEWEHRYYEKSQFSYDGDGVPCVAFFGHWYVWSIDGETYDVAFADVTVPLWVLTDPDGPDRFRAETRDRVAQAELAEAARAAEIDALCEVIFAQHTIMAEQGASQEEIRSASMDSAIAGLLALTESPAERDARS